MTDRPHRTEALVDDPTLPAVAGAELPTSLAEFERRCRLLLATEQAKPNPDNALVDALCNGVRLAREYASPVGVFRNQRDQLRDMRAALLGDGATDPQFPPGLWPIECVTMVVATATTAHEIGTLIPADEDREATGEALDEARRAVSTLRGIAKALATEVAP